MTSLRLAYLTEIHHKYRRGPRVPWGRRGLPGGRL
jgi:hypothetical protein